MSKKNRNHETVVVKDQINHEPGETKTFFKLKLPNIGTNRTNDGVDTDIVTGLKCLLVRKSKALINGSGTNYKSPSMNKTQSDQNNSVLHWLENFHWLAERAIHKSGQHFLPCEHPLQAVETGKKSVPMHE